MARRMFEGWDEYYLMVGSAAAVLIGLIFVVVTLMQDRSRSSVLAGSWLYMGPTVLQVSFVLVLCAAALIPGINGREFAVVSGIIAIWGLVRGIYSIIGIRGFRADDSPPHWTDIWFYGAIPSVIFVLLGAVALAFWDGVYWARYEVAGLVIALLLLAIRNEWDLVTWLAPRADDPGEAEPVS